jgi:hypothetical protein
VGVGRKSIIFGNSKSSNHFKKGLGGLKKFALLAAAENVCAIAF